MHRDLVVLGLLGLVALPSRSHAQMRAEDVPLVVEEVLERLVAGKSLSRIPAGKRGIVFDADRTLSSFERAGVPRSARMRDLAVSVAVKPASRSALFDCSQSVARQCGGLGWGVYSAIEFVGLRGDSLDVKAVFLWSDRGRAPFVEGVAPTGRGFLVGFTTPVVLVRDPVGKWLLVREGPSAVR